MLGARSGALVLVISARHTIRTLTVMVSIKLYTFFHIFAYSPKKLRKFEFFGRDILTRQFFRAGAVRHRSDVSRQTEFRPR